MTHDYDTRDEYGEMRGAPHVPTIPNGATRETAIPEWRARLGHYDTVPTRSRKGRTSYRVTARRPRHMTGLDHERQVTSASNYDVAGWADEYVRYQCALALGAGYVNESRAIAATFAPMLGTDAMSWEAIVRDDASAIDRHGVARHRADIAGGIFHGRDETTRVIRGRRSDGTPYVMTDAGTFGDAHTDRRVSASTVARHVPRYRLTIPRGVKRTPDVRSTVVAGPLDVLGAPLADGTPEWTPATVSRLLAPSATDGMVWRGHRLTPATDPTVRARTGNAARDERRATVREVTRAPWSDVAAEIAPHIGTESTFTVHGVGVTLSAPGQTGRFRAHLVYADGSTRTVQARTADPVARAVMA